MLPFSLEGKRILITGASSGIGRACAICASRLGARVVLTARRLNALEETAAACQGDVPVVLDGDITSPVFVSGLVEKAGKMDGLVHAAGIAPMCPVGMMTREHVEAVMATNYYSFLELMRCYSKRKYRNDRFSVVAVSSVSSRVGWSGGAGYCGSKGALSASVRALAMELSGKGVRVNAVCPSHVRTPMFEAGACTLNDENALRELLKKHPLGLGEPEDVAWPICFLLSEASRFITGTELPVDGGYLAQ